VSRLTITQIAFFFETERGNPVMKSIEIESHFQVGISKVVVHTREVDTQL